jgi:hypothetical protein
MQVAYSNAVRVEPGAEVEAILAVWESPPAAPQYVDPVRQDALGRGL